VPELEQELVPELEQLAPELEVLVPELEELFLVQSIRHRIAGIFPPHRRAVVNQIFLSRDNITVQWNFHRSGNNTLYPRNLAPNLQDNVPYKSTGRLHCKPTWQFPGSQSGKKPEAAHKVVQL